MSEGKKHTGTEEQIDKHAHNVIQVLKRIESHLASMVYYQNPSRGFSAGIERALAQPFTGEMNESTDNTLQELIREEIKKALGDK
jgi:hypothetical protein